MALAEQTMHARSRLSPSSILRFPHPTFLTESSLPYPQGLLSPLSLPALKVAPVSLASGQMPQKLGQSSASVSPSPTPFPHLCGCPCVYQFWIWPRTHRGHRRHWVYSACSGQDVGMSIKGQLSNHAGIRHHEWWAPLI